MSITTYMITFTVITSLHKIAYGESIFKTWWIGATIMLICLIFGEIVGEKVTRK